MNPYTIIRSPAAIASLGGITLAAAGEGPSVSDFQSILSQLQTAVPVSTVVGVIGAVLGITVAFGFMWWGARWGVRKIMASIKKGKVGV